MIRIFLIKILIKSLWNSNYPVNELRKAFDKNNKIFKDAGYKTCKNIIEVTPM